MWAQYLFEKSFFSFSFFRLAPHVSVCEREREGERKCFSFYFLRVGPTGKWHMDTGAKMSKKRPDSGQSSLNGR